MFIVFPLHILGSIHIAVNMTDRTLILKEVYFLMRARKDTDC